MLTENTSVVIDYKALIASTRYQLSFQQGGFSLSPYSADELKSCHAGECGKFAQATIETLNGITVEAGLSRHQAWPAIRVYYAAFYAAHLLIRLFGSACTFIDDVPLARLNEVASLTGGSAIKQGFYLVEEDHGSLRFKAIKDSHRDTWATLHHTVIKLREMVQSVSAPRQDKIDATITLTELISAIDSGNGDKSRLSRFRNKVQYRFEKSAWFPFGVKTPPGYDINHHTNLAARGMYGRVTANSEIFEFFDAALFISSFAISLFKEVENAKPSLHPNLTRNYRQLCNLIAA
ncbi:MAG: hypothetical protein ACFE0P_13855 [Oceanicaulis sp.]